MHDDRTIDVVDGQMLHRPPAELVKLTHVLYALHAVGLGIGAFSAVTIVGAFVFCWPSIIALIINYVKRDAVRGSFLASHFAWQSDTFWRCAVLLIVGFVLYLLLVGFFINWLIFGIAGIWAIWRIIKGWMALAEGRPVR